MQDRFRYRVWDKTQNKWLHFDFSTYPTYQDRIWQALTDGETFYQCTGLKDKNGKLIYEGDIVKIFHVSGTMQGKLFTDVVEWNELRYRFDTEKYGVFDEDDTYEVIGNIYENPELLED